MPHKHKRRGKDNGEHYDLPPSKVAKALPAKSDKAGNSKNGETQAKNTRRKGKPSHTDDFGGDTPREFARMMRKFQQAMSGKKDGDNTTSENGPSNEKPNRKRKRAAEETVIEGTGKTKNPKVQKENTNTLPVPKILPGEKLSDFAARVDQALPLSGVTRKGGNKGDSKIDAEIRNLREHRQTKHEKRLLRLQTQWREDEAKLREKEAAEKEEKEAEYDEVNETWKQWEEEAGKGKKKKKKSSKKKKRKGGAAADGGVSDISDGEDDDPWAKLNKKKRASRPINPFDVVQAPPEKLTKVREIFKVRGATVDVANVPTAAGSLRRREELASHRQNIVEEYRRIMAAKRGE